MSSRCDSRVKIADDIGPFARRGERNRAGPLADGQALDRHESDVGFNRKPRFERREQARAQLPRLRLAGDADEQRRRLRRTAVSVHGASIPVGKGAARRRTGTVGRSSRLLGRPSGGSAEFDRRTAGLLARSVSPTPPSRACESPVAKKRRHAAHSRGGGHGSAKAYRVPFSPSVAIEGPCLGHVPASEGVVKSGTTRFTEPLRRARSSPQSQRRNPLPRSKRHWRGGQRATLRTVWAASLGDRTGCATPTTP